MKVLTLVLMVLSVVSSLNAGTINVTKPTSGTYFKYCKMQIQYSVSIWGYWHQRCYLIKGNNTIAWFDHTCTPGLSELFDYKIPANAPPGGSYRVKVRHIEDPSDCDFSDYFIVALPTIDILKPGAAANESYSVGQKIYIQWSKNRYTQPCNELYRVRLMQGNTIVDYPSLGVNSANGGIYYTIPSQVTPGSGYYIQITMKDDAGVRGHSDHNFTIAAAEIASNTKEDGSLSATNQSNPEKTGDIYVKVFPNPVGTEALIEYTLPLPGNISINIYNSAGALVRTLDQGFRNAGPHSVRWDIKSNQGLGVRNGIYFYAICQGTEVKRGKITVLK
jgi:hypothetical protein